jgi:HlyD family secretion protein
MNSTVVQNVVTYDTIIEFDNPELKLFPGMTAYVTIPVATVQNVVKVPNAALRFKPDLSANEMRSLYRKSGIPEEGDGAGETKAPAAGRTTGNSPPPSGPTKPATGPRNETRIVWKLVSGKTLEPVAIKTGITDHTNTELTQVANGKLEAGDALVTGVAQRSTEKTPGGPRRP